MLSSAMEIQVRQWRRKRRNARRKNENARGTKEEDKGDASNTGDMNNRKKEREKIHNA